MLVTTDAFTWLAAALIAGLATVTGRFAFRALAGDPRRPAFMRALVVTSVCAVATVIADNLLVVTLAWLGTSLGLDRLLRFHPERRAAVLAAHQKFAVSRLGDLCLIAALVVA